jgi:phage repressor protein C with HTH and peptisase S24 domain
MKASHAHTADQRPGGQTKGVKNTVTYDRTTYGIIELDVRAQGGAGALLDEHSEHRVLNEWRIPRDLIRGQTTAPEKKLVIGQIYGDSMEPKFRAGEKVLIDTSDCVPSPPGVFFVWDGLGLVCKHVEVVPYSDPPTVRLTSENVQYEAYSFDLDQVIIQGRVIGKWEWT